MLADLQRGRIAGFKAFIDDVQQGSFPASKQVIKAPVGLIEVFLDDFD